MDTLTPKPPSSRLGCLATTQDVTHKAQVSGAQAQVRVSVYNNRTAQPPQGLLKIGRSQCWAGPEWSCGHFADGKTDLGGKRNHLK